MSPCRGSRYGSTVQGARGYWLAGGSVDGPCYGLRRGRRLELRRQHMQQKRLRVHVLACHQAHAPPAIPAWSVEYSEYRSRICTRARAHVASTRAFLRSALLCSALRRPACNMQQAKMRRTTCSVQRHATRRYSARAWSRSVSAAAALPARSAASAPSQTLPWCAACASHVAQYRGRGAGRNSSAKALTAPRCAERRCRTGMCVWPRL
jgi:hypothetical protein